MVGILLTKSHCRPALVMMADRLSKFLENPGQAHWEAVRNVLRYLNGTQDFWLTFGEKDEDSTG
jgi:hypothetical protein